MQDLLNLCLCSCSCLGNSELILVLLHFLLHHCTLFMYARYTTCGRAARGVGAEPQDGVGGHIQKMEGPAEATEAPAQGRKGPRPW